MNWFKNIKKDTLLYGGLIVTFIVLYGATAFVSFYHAIDLFLIGNAIFLAIILSFVAEIGQASALFSILLTKNKHKFLTWSVMIILTTLQVIGNVYASYDFIEKHNAAGVASFQKAILFFMPTGDPEIFKVIIAWILGALLPIIALSMTALVAQNMILRAEEAKTNLDEVPVDPIPADVIVSEVSKVRFSEEEMSQLADLLSKKTPIEKVPPEEDGVRGKSEEEKKTSNPHDEMTAEEWRVANGHLTPEHRKLVDELSAKNEAELKEPDRPMTSDEIHEEWTKMYDDIHKELDEEEVPPPDELTKEEVENSLLGIEFTPSTSDEVIESMNQDEYDRTGSYQDTLDEEAEMLTPEIVPEPPIPPPIVHGLFEGLGEIKEIPQQPEYTAAGSPIPGVIPAPLPNTTPEDEEKKAQEEAKVERLRQIARDNLKKK